MNLYRTAGFRTWGIENATLLVTKQWLKQRKRMWKRRAGEKQKWRVVEATENVCDEIVVASNKTCATNLKTHSSLLSTKPTQQITTLTHVPRVTHHHILR